MKFGVLGLGSIGWRHANNLRDLGMQVVAFEPKASDDFRIRQKASGLGVNLVSREFLLAESDALVIATPTDNHYRDLIDCMLASKPIFVEKPIASTDREWGDLRGLPRISGVMVGTNLRLHPCVHQAKEWINAGHIGRPLWAQFTCSQLNSKYTDSVVLNWGAHEVDLAIYLLGPVTRVACASIDGGSGFDAVADFVLEHDSGARSSFHLDYITPNEIREAWIVGENKNIGIDFIGRRTSLGSMSTGHNGSWDTDYKDEMCAFIERIEGKDAPGATGEDGLATLKVLLDVRKKAGLT